MTRDPPQTGSRSISARPLSGRSVNGPDMVKPDSRCLRGQVCVFAHRGGANSLPDESSCHYCPGSSNKSHLRSKCGQCCPKSVNPPPASSDIGRSRAHIGRRGREFPELTPRSGRSRARIGRHRHKMPAFAPDSASITRFEGVRVHILPTNSSLRISKCELLDQEHLLGR